MEHIETTNDRLKRIKSELAKCKSNTPTAINVISPDDVDFLVTMAEEYQNARLCKCP